MKKVFIVAASILWGVLVHADNLEGVDVVICAASQVQICIERDTCYDASPEDLDVPAFVIIDTDEKTISTTKASNLNRSTKFNLVSKEDGLIYLQGIEGGRAFSFVIDELTGHMTVAVSRDGIAVSVFGSCTTTDF